LRREVLVNSPSLFLRRNRVRSKLANKIIMKLFFNKQFLLEHNIGWK